MMLALEAFDSLPAQFQRDGAYHQSFSDGAISRLPLANLGGMDSDSFHGRTTAKRITFRSLQSSEVSSWTGVLEAILHAQNYL